MTATTNPKTATVPVPVPVKPVITSTANAATLLGAAFIANPVLGVAAAIASVGMAGVVAARKQTRRTRITLPGGGSNRTKSPRLTRAKGRIAKTPFGQGIAAGNGRAPVRRTLGGLTRRPAAAGTSGRTAVPRQRRGSSITGGGTGTPQRKPLTPRRSKPFTPARVAGGLAGLGVGAAWRGSRAAARVASKGARAGWRKAKGTPPASPRTNQTGRKPAAQPANVGFTARRPQQQTKPGQNRPTSPNPTSRVGAGTTSPKGTPTMPQQQQPTGGGAVFQAARNFLAAVTNHAPKGMLEFRAEAYEYPHTLETVAAALRLRAQQHQAEHPMNPAYVQAVNQLANVVSSAAQTARNLGVAFDTLHQAEIKRLLQPRNGEAMWDTTNNRP